MTPKARKGSYFPITPGHAAELTKEWGHYYDSGVRAPISFSNPTGKAAALPLVALEKKDMITIFSVPDVIATEEAGWAVELALEVCGKLSGSWTTRKGQTRRSYLICFENPATLIVLECTVHYQLRKYRGGQKFTNAFKPRRSRAIFKEVQRVSLD